MQARAIFEAAVEVFKESGETVIPEIMIPLIGTKKEFDILKAVIDKVAGEVMTEQRPQDRISRRHHDRTAARRLAGRSHRRERPSSSASAPTT